MSTASFRLIPRDEWGAQHADGFADRPMPFKAYILHHSAGVAPDLVPPFDDDDAAVRSIERTGQRRFGGGSPYHNAVTPVGRAYRTLSPHRRGAHTAGHNTPFGAIVAVGNYSYVEPTDEMLEAIAQIVAHDYLAGLVESPEIIGGHRDMKGASTACPGAKLHARIPDINARIAELVAEAELAPVKDSTPEPQPATKPKPAPKPEPKPAPKPKPARAPRADDGLLENGDEGKAVREWQEQLETWRPGILARYGADSDFGDETEHATRTFQNAYRLTVDGVVGPQTRGAMRAALAARERPTLRNGDEGKAVKRLQRLLQKDRRGALPRYGADGDFGDETEAEVRSYQLRHRLTVDGVVGPQTWRHLLR